MSYILPSAEHGVELRHAMDASLLESVCLELEKVRPGCQLIPCAEGAAFPDACALDYGAYFDVALLASSNDAATTSAADEAADYLIARILRSGAEKPVQTCAIPVSTLSAAFYSPTEIDRLSRWWDAEPDNPFGLKSVSDEELSKACSWIHKSIDVLGQAVPDLQVEILALIRQIVVARPDGVDRDSFGASSSFALWGSMVIDYVSNDCWPLMYRTIVHEAAHNLLFGIARNEPLVENVPEERFPSPVRRDLRPMDGIFHAAFVSARESLALEGLLAWHEKTGSLEQSDVRLILRLLEISVMNFSECSRTINEWGKLTSLGFRILADCQSFMDQNFALKPA